MKFWHVVVVFAIALAAVWASNNVQIIGKVTA